MLPPRRSDRDDYSALRDPEQPKTPELEPEPNRPKEIRAPVWDGVGDRVSEERAAERLAKHNQQVQQQKFEERKAAEPAPEPTPENDKKIEEARLQETQQTDHKPEEDRDHSRPAEATADRGEEKKKAEEQEFDAKRFMNDPDYRRQMKEQRQAEQRERSEDRQREGSENVFVTDHQR